MSNEGEGEIDFVLLDKEEANEEIFPIESEEVKANENNYKQYYSVNCNKLAIRKEPSATSEIVCIKTIGSLLLIDEDFNNSDWFKVRSDSTCEEGYCMKKFLDYYGVFSHAEGIPNEYLHSEKLMEEQQGGTNDE